MCQAGDLGERDYTGPGRLLIVAAAAATSATDLVALATGSFKGKGKGADKWIPQDCARAMDELAPLLAKRPTDRSLYARRADLRRVAARPRRGYSSGGESRRRRGCDVDNKVEAGRGDAAAATLIFTWRRVAATPRLRR